MAIHVDYILHPIFAMFHVAIIMLLAVLIHDIIYWAINGYTCRPNVSFLMNTSLPKKRHMVLTSNVSIVRICLTSFWQLLPIFFFKFSGQQFKALFWWTSGRGPVHACWFFCIYCVLFLCILCYVNLANVFDIWWIKKYLSVIVNAVLWSWLVTYWHSVSLMIVNVTRRGHWK